MKRAPQSPRPSRNGGALPVVWSGESPSLDKALEFPVKPGKFP
jgi:hypothetical protein